MTVTELREHFVERAYWIDPEKTVDQVIIGDGGKEVATCLVTWISSFSAVRTAVYSGVDLLVTHEPTFYEHGNELNEADFDGIAGEKKRFIEETGLTILRLHDTWDRWPDVGIPWAWARFLELPGPPAADDGGEFPSLQQRYDIEPIPLERFAASIAKKTADIGEPLVQVIGNPAQIVSKVGIGTGCACNIDVYRGLGCDVSIVCDDGSSYWKGIQEAEDGEHPVIRVNHGTSEEPGMVSLTEYLNATFDTIQATHLPHGATFALRGNRG
jgi:putative NIF3 family GTP cyclohydrolase 1 type 2